MTPVSMAHRLLAPLVLAASLLGCSSTPAEPQTSPEPTKEETSMAEGFTNPVYATNFPDPMIVADGDGFIAFATNGNTMNVQTATSDDMVTWTQGSDALPTLPKWSSPGKVWAPEAFKWSDGTYRMYYTTMVVGKDRQCLSVATSDTAAGPYIDNSTEPLMCEVDEGGSIDSSPFVASDGTAWLYWKNDGNHIGVDTFIRVAPLSADGMSVEGETIDVLKQDLPWEDMLVEGPNVWERDGKFHMFYSGNGFWTDRYAVGHAVGDSPTGPFVKDPEPVLTSNDVAAGPGHNSLIEVEGQVWMVYHAWEPGHISDDFYGRQMWLSLVEFNDDGTVEVQPPLANNPDLPKATS